MPLFGPNTLGTLVILFATVLMLVVLASAPYNKDVYFLAAVVNSGVSKLNQAGILKMGVFGYCISDRGQDSCSTPSVGYPLDPKFLLGVPQLPEMIKLSDTLIQTVTKALVLHALAAVLGILSLISGAVSHIQEFSKTCWTSCLASLAASTMLLVLIFDLIFFSIIRARINSMSTPDNPIKADLGNAMWLTILAWLCLAFSGCFFCAGRCLCSFRRSKRHNDHIKLQSYEPEK